MLLQAQLTNFTLDIVDGVLGSEVAPKALPYVSASLLSRPMVLILIYVYK